MLLTPLVVLLLVACPGPQASTPTFVPPTPTAGPVMPTPQGWVAQQTRGLSIQLPGDWRVLRPGEEDAAALFEAFRERDPDLAALIGSAEALMGMELWAFSEAESDAAFVDNLNVRRSPLAGTRIEHMQEVVDSLTAQYQRLGFDVMGSQADLLLGGVPAAHIAYRFRAAAADGTRAYLAGHQYIIAAPTDLWILSYATDQANEPASLPIFEQSARSVRLK